MFKRAAIQAKGMVVLERNSQANITLLSVDIYSWAAMLPTCNGTKSDGGAA